MKRFTHIAMAALLVSLSVVACNDDPLIDVDNQAPIANAGPDQTVVDTDGSGSEQVTLDGSGSSDADGTIASYVWTEGGTSVGTGVAPVVTLAVGTHDITLTVTDNGGATDTDGVTITVQPQPVEENTPPTAAITEPTEAAVFDIGADVTFTGSGDDAEDGALTGASLVWTSDVDGEIGTGETFTINTLTTGAHVITLTATDSEAATGTATVNIAVTTAPTAEITEPADASEFLDFEVITFTGSGTDVEDGALTDASLVWTSDIDGEIGTGETFDANAADLTLGAHVITLTATDSNGATGTATVGITINEATSTVSFAEQILPYFNDSGCNGCHGAANLGDIQLDSYTAVTTDSNGNGVLLVKGDASLGILIPKLEAAHNDGADDQAFVDDLLTVWINDGAPNN
ncbi:MAG: PKD domain-containing protein [Gemmatimonadota bacterium]